MKTLDAFIVTHRKFLTAGLVVVMLAGYSTTVSPTVSFVDSGELAAVASTLGIAHPTGYPLFTIVGRLVVMTVPAEPVAVLNFLAALFVACSVGLFFNLMLELWSPSLFASDGPWAGGGSSAALSAMLFGFSTTVWAQAVTVEVYSLHLLLVLLFLLLFVRGISESTGGTSSRTLLLAAFVLGLGFANHMTMVLVVPGCLYVYLAAVRFRGALRRLIPLGIIALIAVSWYVYLPVRAESYPPLDWGHPVTGERVLWHITGKQYSGWIFSGWDAARKQLDYFFGNFTQVFTWPAIVLMLIGIWTLVVRVRRVFWFSSLMFVACLAYAVNYDIHDIDSYFLLAYIAAGIWMAAGLRTVLGSVRNFPSGFLLIFLLVLPIDEFLSHRETVDESENFLVEEYVANVFANLDSNAVVFTYQWDYFVSASYYYQLVGGMRPDVTVIDKELLRRSWYFIQLERNFPWLVRPVKDRIDAFLAELYKFEHGLPYNGAEIDRRFDAVVNGLIESAISDRPVYLGPEIEAKFAPGLQRTPEGLMMRLRPPGIVPPLKELEFFYTPTNFRSRLEGGLKLQYAKMFTLRAIWLEKQEGRDGEAREWLRKALQVDPSFVAAQRILLDLNK